MADWKGMMGKSSGFGDDHEEFEEEDVWSFIKEREDSTSKIMRKPRGREYYSSGSSSAWRLPSAPRMIPRVYPTPTTQEACRVVQQSSAPVDIPDWSKIYGKTSAQILDSSSPAGSFVDDDDDNDDGDMVPPHEWIARKLARSQISSFSVCEGIGRTLKGRDLSKVRNAILTKTGFLE